MLQADAVMGAVEPRFEVRKYEMWTCVNGRGVFLTEAQSDRASPNIELTLELFYTGANYAAACITH